MVVVPSFGLGYKLMIAIATSSVTVVQTQSMFPSLYHKLDESNKICLVAASHHVVAKIAIALGLCTGLSGRIMQFRDVIMPEFLVLLLEALTALLPSLVVQLDPRHTH